MKGSSLMAIVMLLLLIFACFLSVPVLAEGPWDTGDNTSNSDPGTTTGIDTTDSNGGESMYANPGDEPGGNSWYNDWLFMITVRVIILGLTYSNTSSEQM